MGEMQDRMKMGMRVFAVAMVPLTMNFSSVRTHGRFGLLAVSAALMHYAR